MGNTADKWVEQICNKATEETKNTQCFTLKGKATTDPFEIEQLGLGWQGGFDYANENWTEGGCMDTFPEFMRHEHGFYWNGWAEGVRYAIGKHLDRLYPGAISLSYNTITKKYDAKY